MEYNPKKEKIVNAEGNAEPVQAQDDMNEKEIANAPLAPYDPRLKKPGDVTEQSNEDPLNGVNE